MLIQFIVPPILLVVSLLLTPIAGKSPRLRVAWAFLGLWLVPFLVSFLPAAWNPGIEPIRNIAHALLELAGVQLAAIVVFEILLRRLTLNKFVVEGIIGMASAVILINLLYGLGVTPIGILATSAVTVAIVVLALHDLISSVAGGIVLDLAGGIKVGDYIQCGEWSGWVESLSLGQTTIKDLAGDEIILPNSQLYRTPVRICAPLHRRIVSFVMPHGVDSQEVIETVEFALRASPMEGITTDPPPECTIREMTVSAVTYAIAFWVTGPGDHDAESSTVFTRLGFALDRAGLPCEVPNVMEVRSENSARKQPVTPIELLRRAPILRLLDEDDIQRLASGLHRFSFGPGELIVRQGEPGESMYFIGKGKVSILFNSGDGVERQVASMESGDFFGEASLLTGEARSATVQSLSRVDCYELPKEGLRDFIQRRSDLLEDIATVMARRQMELRELREKLDAETAAVREAEVRRQFMASVQRFFGWKGDRPTNPGPGHPDSPAAVAPAPLPQFRSSKPQERPHLQSDRPSLLDAQMAKASNPAAPERTERVAYRVSPLVRPDSTPIADAARERAARLLNDGKYAEALQALTEADAIEKTAVESALTQTKQAARKVADPRRAGTVDKALKIVNRYSKIAAGAGLVPGALINFALILTVQVTMVWKLARCFGNKETVERVRGSIMSLLASGIPAALGHGTALAVTTTAVVAGSLLYFLFTPVLAYAVTQAVGRTFVMHFESGGTLLTFDATAFQDYFLSEFHRVHRKSSVEKKVAA
jgi:CRP-like cAMP-binding protein/small-conductance mechanosensitive channel/uncharacterized protein (DUF697 family)